MSDYGSVPDDILIVRLAQTENRYPLDANRIDNHLLRVNARRYNLKKDIRHIHQFDIEKEIARLGKKPRDYCGSPSKEIRRIVPTDCAVLTSCSRSDVRSLRTACWRYNMGEGKEMGVKIKVLYDSIRRIAVMITELYPRTSPYTSLSSQEAVQYVPP